MDRRRADGEDPLTIAVFAPYDLAVPGGVGSHIRAQARALRTLGHRVRIYGPASAPLSDGEIALSGSFTVNFSGTASGAAFDPRVVSRTKDVFARERFDIVHVHEPLMPLLPWSAVWYANAPVVATFHVHREQGHPFYPVARPLLNRIMRRIRVRIAVSPAALETVSRFFPGEYETIPNGIELARFRTERPRPTQIPRGPAVVCVGRLEPRKGVATLVDAMATVQGQIPDASLVLVGSGPDAAALAEQSRRLAVRTVFVANVSDDEVAAFYQHADVVCAPALGGESFGIVLIEALAAGKPVVASRIDGYASAVGTSSAVRLVPPGNAVALAAQLVEVLEDRRMTWRAEATRLAAVYDWDRIAERLAAVYERTSHAARRTMQP